MVASMPDTTPQRFLKLDQVGDELNISANQVYALVRRGDLAAIKIGGRGQWRVERDRLEEYIERVYEDTRAFIEAHPIQEDAPELAIDGVREPLTSRGTASPAVTRAENEGDDRPVASSNDSPSTGRAELQPPTASLADRARAHRVNETASNPATAEPAAQPDPTMDRRQPGL